VIGEWIDGLMETSSAIFSINPKIHQSNDPSIQSSIAPFRPEVKSAYGSS
jgi:hypothetical protein